MLVCLCGSTRFINQFHEANVELTKRGLGVVSISMAMPKERPDDGLKELLDIVHFDKILRADAVFIVGDGYIGHSTAREILWARMQRKPIITQWSSPDWDTTARRIKNRADANAQSVEDLAMQVLKV